MTTPDRQRVPYSEAAQAMRAALARGRCANLTRFEFNVLVAASELVPSYSRRSDTVSARQVAAIAYGIADTRKVEGWQRFQQNQDIAPPSKPEVASSSKRDSRLPFPASPPPNQQQSSRPKQGGEDRRRSSRMIG